MTASAGWFLQIELVKEEKWLLSILQTLLPIPNSLELVTLALKMLLKLSLLLTLQVVLKMAARIMPVL